jgi:hypothetical protein
VYPDNKKDNGRQDKPGLSDIDGHTLHNREEERLCHFDDREEEKEEQTCRKFVCIPFHFKEYCHECDNYLYNFIENFEKSRNLYNFANKLFKKPTKKKHELIAYSMNMFYC